MNVSLNFPDASAKKACRGGLGEMGIEEIDAEDLEYGRDSKKI